MTRRALRAAVPARLLPDIVRWRDTQIVSRALRRAGFRPLPDEHHGIERAVLLGRAVVVKTTGWKTSHLLRKRSRCLAPTIRIAPDIILQARGRVLCREKDLRAQCRDDTSALYRRWKRSAAVAYDLYHCTDDHSGNYALYPDGTVRCIDF